MKVEPHVEECFYRRWLPINVERQTQAIRWMDFGKEELSGFMLDHFIDQLRRSVPAPREWDTDFRTLLATAGHLNRVVPTGLIFHVSRCGSTLLSNTLRTDANLVVMSEPSIVNMLLTKVPGNAFWELFTRTGTRDAERRQLVESVTTLYGHRMLLRPARGLVIKFNDVGIVHLPEIMEWWPNMRAVVLVRNPVEVIASNMLHPTGFLKGTEKSPATTGPVFGWTEERLRRMPKEEKCARIIGRIQEIALAYTNSRCRIVDYADLSVGRIREISQFLGANLPSEESGVVDQAMAVYSKDSSQSTAFDSDSADKQRNASDSVKRAAERWAQSGYRALLREARTCWSGPARLDVKCTF